MVAEKTEANGVLQFWENSGVYDKPTFDAVAKFQKDMGITLSEKHYGFVRNKTFAAIIEFSGTWINPGDSIDR